MYERGSLIKFVGNLNIIKDTNHQHVLTHVYIDTYTWIHFLKFLFERQRNRQTEPSVHWFITQMSTIPRLGQYEVRTKDSV